MTGTRREDVATPEQDVQPDRAPGGPAAPVSGPAAPVSGPAAPVLAPGDAEALLGLARAAVEAGARGDRAPTVDPSSLPDTVREPAAVFVTLHVDGELRGCMGVLDDRAPLWRNVLRAGLLAALDDPRFMPVGVRELPAIRIEVSVLGPMAELPGAAAFDAASEGIVVERDGRRALLLPQVAEEYGWGAAETLDAVCRKAGLRHDAWQMPGTRLLAFRDVHVAERGFQAGDRGPSHP